MADMFRIKSQVQDTVISDTGPGFDTIWKVTYVVTSGPAEGTQGFVNIPVRQYNKDTVVKAISAAIYHLDQVAGL